MLSFLMHNISYPLKLGQTTGNIHLFTLKGKKKKQGKTWMH